MKLSSLFLVAITSTTLLIGGCGHLGMPGQPQPDAAMVLMNPSAAADFDRIPPSLKTYLQDLSKDADISSVQQAQISAIALKYKTAPAFKPDGGKRPDFRPLFLADPIDAAALRRFFAVDDTAGQDAITRNADMMVEIRNALSPVQQEKIAAFLLAHPDPIQGSHATKREEPQAGAPANIFGMMIDPLLDGVTLREDQSQRFNDLKTAFASNVAPKAPDFYLKKIIAFIRNGDKDAYLADVQARAARGMPVKEMVDAISCLDLAQRKQIAANFDALSKHFPAPRQ